ncbi:ribosome-inactivating family protein [Streptomyces sp. PCS3-D2]|nr:ribosome-inactivating family protein [Streptomyces sp. PCS3-D2]
MDVIGATAEAARFGYVFDVIRQNIAHHASTPIGPFGADLETSWGQLSAWVYARLRNPAGNGFTIGAQGYSRYYPTVAALIANLGYIQLNGHKRGG